MRVRAVAAVSQPRLAGLLADALVRTRHRTARVAVELIARVAATLGAQIRETEFCTEVFAEGVVGFDDARLDQHLAGCHVGDLDQLADFFELGWRIGDEQLVGAWIDRCTAALGQDPVLAIAGRAVETEHHPERLGLLIIELECFSPERFQLGDLGALLQFEFFLGQQFILRRDPDHRAVLTHVETLGLHNDIERLIPWHVLEPQCHVAADGVAGDDVETSKIGNHLQHGAHFDILEIERQFLAAVTLGALGQLVRLFLDRPHFDDQLGITLVRTVFPQPFGLDHHVHVVSLGSRRHGRDRCAEIHDVETAAQHFRQARFHEVDHHGLTLLAHIDADLVVRQIDHDPAFAIRTATEVDVAQGLTADRCARGRHCGRGCTRNWLSRR